MPKKTSKTNKGQASSVKGSSIIDFIKYLSSQKKPWEDLSDIDKKNFNPFMINRWLSMNNDLIEVVNQLQPYTIGQLDKKIVYKLYLNLLPKQNIFIRYIKGSKQGTYQSNLIDFIKSHYEIGEKEALEFLDVYYSSEERLADLDSLITKYGIKEADRAKMMKL